MELATKIKLKTPIEARKSITCLGKLTASPRAYLQEMLLSATQKPWQIPKATRATKRTQAKMIQMQTPKLGLMMRMIWMDISKSLYISSQRSRDVAALYNND